MADARLDLEVGLDGDQQAAAGLDRVAKATTEVRDSAWGARQAHEDWVKGYRNETFSEMAEKIKRVSHVTRKTNPSLKWMGEGFTSANGAAIDLSGTLGSLRHTTVAAQQAQLAFAMAMRGNFVGAARAATAAVATLWKVIKANPYVAVIGAAIGLLVGLVRWHGNAARAAREQKAALQELDDQIMGMAGHDAPSVIGEAAKNMGDADLLSRRNAAAEDMDAKRKRAEDTGWRAAKGPRWFKVDGKWTHKNRGELDSEAQAAMRDYSDAANKVQAYNDEIDRRVAEKEEAAAAKSPGTDSPGVKTPQPKLPSIDPAAKWKMDTDQAFNEFETKLSKEAEAAEKASRAALEKDVAEFKKASDEKIKIKADEVKANGRADAQEKARRVVEGADYSLKEFDPGARRFRGMGRQGFMGNGQGHAAAWFANQTAGRFAASGHVGVPSQMGRPLLDVNGIDQTNKLLAEIKERLA